MELTPDEITAGLLDASLPQAAWTHAAHVHAAHVLCTRHGSDRALEIMRDAIPRLNEAHGVANSDSGGYHETLTVFFVAAVGDCVDRGLQTRETLEALPRDAPLACWSREVLMSVEARRTYVAPDRSTPGFLTDRR